VSRPGKCSYAFHLEPLTGTWSRLLGQDPGGEGAVRAASVPIPKTGRTGHAVTGAEPMAEHAAQPIQRSSGPARSAAINLMRRASAGQAADDLPGELGLTGACDETCDETGQGR
jgi:hypothetical protein